MNKKLNLLFTAFVLIPTLLATQPNFIIIFTDDQDYGDLSCFGGEHVNTPSIAKTPHKAFFYHRGDELLAVRSGHWKLHINEGKTSELYNLKNDIGESNNVLNRHPQIAKRLMGQIDAFAADLAANSRPAAIVDNPKALDIRQ